jgi:16S rRNA (guanine527-N7)-methyltransferase
VEHLTNLKLISDRTGITDEHKLSLLDAYAEAIHEENKKYNLTGHKSIQEVIENLIIGSIEPLSVIIVPRGTLFADLGTGAGIPGIPFAIKYDESTGVLFDSNQKKIRFINKTSDELTISNVQGVSLRVEDAGRENNYREKFDLVITRAMSDIYTIAELGAPLLKTGGNILLYINENQKNYTDNLLSHLDELGLSMDTGRSLTMTGTDKFDGLLLTKIKPTNNKYPRRMPVISRMALK